MARRRNAGQGIHAIMLTLQIPIHAALWLALINHVKTAIRVSITGLPIGIGAKLFHRCPAAFFNHTAQARFFAICHHQTLLWHSAH